MAPTALPIIAVGGPFDAVSANSQDFVFTAGDNVNGNDFVCTGRELLLVQNADAGAQTVTITSVDDEKGRSEDITAYSLAAGEFARFAQGLTNSKGWKQTSGKVTLACSSANIKFAVMRLSAGFPK